MGRALFYAVVSAFNPPLVAIVVLMASLRRPRQLMTAYLMGAMLTSVACGLALVYSLHGTPTASTTEHSVDPVFDITLGVLILVIVVIVGTGHDQRRRAWSEHRRERRDAKAKDKGEPFWKRLLNKGSPRDAFIVGMVLSFPGAAYVAGMNRLAKQGLGPVLVLISVIVFNLIMLILIEAPLIGFALSPERTVAAGHRLQTALKQHGAQVAFVLGIAVGVLLIARGITGAVL